MSDTIVAAIIGVIGIIIGALVNKILLNIKVREKGIYYLKPNQNQDFDNLLTSVEEIRMYTVNSYELCNRVNTLLEQRENVFLRKLTILIRKKDTETVKDIEIINNVISIWKRWELEGRIRELTIIGYKNDPDHYYTILGDKLVFTGHVFFDDSKPTGTNISYRPLICCNNTELGRKIIRNYKKHFDHIVDKYQSENTIYSSEKD